MEQTYEAGRRMGQRIWGKSRFERMERSARELHPAFCELALEAWNIFARPGLAPRVRSLILVGALTALGREEELRLHIFGALNNGASQEEIEEAIVQVAPYSGLPTARGALLVAKRCFSEYQRPEDIP
jgi:4-carboxymuconolactone decarboxylase